MLWKTRHGIGRGFGLVELMAGIAILSLVALPLLRIFISGGILSEKTSVLGEATLLAQNVAEAALSKSMPDLLTSPPWSAGDPRFYIPSEARGEENVLHPLNQTPPIGEDRYHIVLQGLETTAHKTPYDALITLDATSIPGGQGLGVARHAPMDAVFAQPFENDMNPDVIAERSLGEEAERLAASRDYVDTTLQKGGHTRRTIKITILHNEASRLITATAVYTYEALYTYTYRHPINTTDEDGEPLPAYELRSETVIPTTRYQYEFYETHYPAAKDAGENPARNVLTNLYFFYYPTYNGTDEIILYNNYRVGAVDINPDDKPLDFEIFLVKQRPVGGGFFVNEDAYEPSVRLYQNPLGTVLDALELPKIPSIYTNLHHYLDRPDSIIPSAGGSFRAQVGFRSYECHYASNAYGDGLLMLREVNRLYKLTVALYPAGTLSEPPIDTAACKPFVVFTASKTG